MDMEQVSGVGAMHSNSLRLRRRGPKVRALIALLALTTALVGVPSWARADELSHRLIKELERRDKIIKRLAARVKVLEEKIAGLQQPAVAQVSAGRGVTGPHARSGSKRFVLSDAELDRIVAGSLPRQLGAGTRASSRSGELLAPARDVNIQLSQATTSQSAEPKPTPTAPAGAAAPTTAAAPSISTDASGQDQEEERNVLRVPLASVARGGNLLRPGQFQIEPGLTYSYAENTRLIMTGFSVIPLVILGTLESEKVKSNVVSSSLSFRYGVIRDLQLDVQLPFVWSDRDRTRLSNDEVKLTSESESDFGVGDLGFGLTYQPIYESGWIPDVTLSGRVRAPTGRSQFDIFNDIAQGGRFGSVDEFVTSLDDQGLATGFGFWGLTLGTSFVKSADPAVLFGSVGYTFNFAKDVTTVGLVQDPRGDAVAIVPTVVDTRFDPGDSVQFNVGFALALNSQMSVNFGFSDRIVFESSQNGVNITDSDLHIAQFNTGFTLALRPRLSIDVTGAFGLTPDAPDFSLGMSLPMSFNSYQDLIPASWRSG